MSAYLLDTNIISDLVRNPSGQVARRIEHLHPDDLCTSIIVAAELRYGCAKKGSAKLLARVESVLTFIPVLPFDIPADGEYGGIRAELEAAGQIIGMNDLLIASHAYSLKVTLVTNNIREFSRIRGLKVENWLEDMS
ncbi:MAG: type II toxin-antitoxin system VapC family toxin [Acetobacter sp.]|nr:type II toxin-antitoxin system VapC family toxin [Acetobacter sp.]MCI1485803.1 type II toxin-antitoxin system VapC family toxin [Acetobacter sp.]MCI1529816.1 type II toxin-antitoxin system VapC family toxin [Acetobacter sp.]MCI1587516.1 type II toxin-antitoxin system VapC family toxin [Acetobacter sp.]MCI1601732.1 type II toxin-antitoxin system VapC family toxin [Acetobacter sp.]